MRQEWKDGGVEVDDNLSRLPNIMSSTGSRKTMERKSIKSLKRGDDLKE